ITSADPNTNTFTIDALAPSAPAIASPANGSTITSNVPAISGTAETGSIVSVTIDGTLRGTVTATGATWSFTSAALADGAHMASATATDAVGNVSPASATVSFSVETAAAVAPVLASPVNGAALVSATPALSGTSEPGAIVTVVIDRTAAGTTTATGGGAW